MATPHLSYRDKDTSLGESVNPLLRTVDDSDDGSGATGHLLIVRRGSAWSNKTFVVPPDEEYYACAVAYAIASDPDNPGYSDSPLLIANQCASEWAALDETAWHSGHKPAFQYNTRGVPPWYMRNAPSSTTLYNTRSYVECGGTRQNLHFNCRAIPANIGTTTQTFGAYLRFWNPSYIHANVDMDQWPDYEQAAYADSQRITKTICQARAYTMSVNTFDRCWYVFDADGDEKAPDAITDSNAGYCDFYGFANQGRGNLNLNGEMVFVLRYDPWNAHHYANATSLLMYQRTGFYAQGTTMNNFTTAAYYADHQITGTQLAALMKSVRDTGGAWLQIGFRPQSIHAQNINGTSFTPATGSTATVYFSRVELVFKITGSAAN